MGCVEVRHVSFAYGGASPLLCDLDFCVPDGSFFSILGPSGGGKTTLLRLLAGLLRPCAGSVVCAGREVLAPGRDRAIVFQQGGLFPWLTALGNVAFAASKTHPGMSRKECRSLASSMLDRVGLSQDMNKWPVQLSGGMRQRVSIARALASRPAIILVGQHSFSGRHKKHACHGSALSPAARTLAAHHNSLLRAAQAFYCALQQGAQSPGHIRGPAAFPA